MGKFLQLEKPRQAAFKANSDTFSEGARVDGVYRVHPYPFCLPREYASENLFPDIRESITKYFSEREIKWHDTPGWRGRKMTLLS